MYQHDVTITRGTGIWGLFCHQCGFSAEYNGKKLSINSMGDVTAMHKGIYFELTENNVFMPVYLAEQIDEIVKNAR